MVRYWVSECMRSADYFPERFYHFVPTLIINMSPSHSTSVSTLSIVRLSKSGPTDVVVRHCVFFFLNTLVTYTYSDRGRVRRE